MKLKTPLLISLILLSILGCGKKDDDSKKDPVKPENVVTNQNTESSDADVTEQSEGEQSCASVETELRKVLGDEYSQWESYLEKLDDDKKSSSNELIKSFDEWAEFYLDSGRTPRAKTSFRQLVRLNCD